MNPRLVSARIIMGLTYHVELHQRLTIAINAIFVIKSINSVIDLQLRPLHIILIIDQ